LADALEDEDQPAAALVALPGVLDLGEGTGSTPIRSSPLAARSMTCGRACMTRSNGMVPAPLPEISSPELPFVTRGWP